MIGIVNVDFEKNYNHLFDDLMMMMMIIDFDIMVEHLTLNLMMLLNHEMYFDVVKVENLLVVTQTINV